MKLYAILCLISFTGLSASSNPNSPDKKNGKPRKFDPQNPRHNTPSNPNINKTLNSPLSKLTGMSAKDALTKLGATEKLKPQKLF